MRLDAQDPQAIAQAAQALADGRLLGLPTETVYGLAARADRDEAVAAVFQAKGRPVSHPLIVHVAEVSDALAFAADWPDLAQRLVRQFWPGPLTVIVPRAAHLATVAAAGQPTIALRCPANPAALAVLKAARALGVLGVAAPSANRFGRISPTTAQHVFDELGPDLLVLDAGPSVLGIESSIVDCSRDRAVLLRPGVLTKAALQAALGAPLHDADLLAPRSPGTLEAHYAPRAALRLMSSVDLARGLQALAGTGVSLAVYARQAVVPKQAGLIHRVMPLAPAGAAQELFATLRELDAQGVPLIWVESPPDDAAWDGVRDRLQRASQHLT